MPERSPDIGSDHVIRKAFARELHAMRGMLQSSPRTQTDIEFDYEKERQGDAQ